MKNEKLIIVSGIAQMVVPSKYEALSSNSNNNNKKNQTVKNHPYNQTKPTKQFL
jgi:hypothetical protein